MKRQKERDRDSEKQPQPDKAEVICPLIFKITQLAVNYDLTWQPETKLTVTYDHGEVEEVTGVWKSSPVQRGHAEAFQSALNKMKADDSVSWDETSYYFTHKEGVEARKEYEKEVLEGRIKAHITSWGPNPQKAEDKSRFHKFTGVTFEELKEKHPSLYEKKSTYTPKKKEEEVKTPEVEQKESVEVAEVEEPKVEVEPSSSELKEIERTAAATMVDETIDQIVKEGIDDDEVDDHTTVVMYVPADASTERIDVRNESITWRTYGGETANAYLMELPEVDMELWLPVGKIEINGQKFEVKVEE